jgi:hypothetical protein
MTKDDYLRIAREIGLDEETANGYPSDRKIIAFASTIAALEREECAKVCEDILAYDSYDASLSFAAAIRNKGE